MIRNRILVTSILCAALILPAYGNPGLKPDFIEKLYPEGQMYGGSGKSNGLHGEEIMEKNQFLRNVGDDARMEFYFPEKCNGQMLVCCPGGGYRVLSYLNYGAMCAEWCMKRNIACCVLVYRLPNHNCDIPLTDACNALSYCRANMSKWGISQLGILGGSAGGHLAACASNLCDDFVRPDFCVLLYPVISFDPAMAHPGSRSYLFDKKQIEEQSDELERYSAEKQVTFRTPPTIIFLSSDDKSVKPENSLAYYRALLDNNINAELHVFPEGGHGWGFYTQENFGVDYLGEPYRSEFNIILENWLSKIHDSLTKR